MHKNAGNRLSSKRLLNMLCFITSLAACGVFTSNSAYAFTFKVATISPDGSVWMEQLRAGAAQIKKQTEGRVKFKFYPGGVMGNDKAVMRKIRIHQLHGGAFTSNAVVRFNRDIQAYNLLDMFHSYDEVSYVRDRMDDKMLSGLDDGGLVALGFSEIGFAYLMSTKPIRSLDDVRNSKSWVPDNDKNALEALKKFGISPIPLPFGDVLLGLQTGMVETVAASPIAAIALQWHTQVKYVVDLPLLYIYGIFALDKKAFNKITPEDQQVVREIMRKAIKEIDKQNRLDNQNAFEALVKSDVQVIKPTAEVYQEFRDISQRANQGQVSKGNISQSVYQEVSQLVEDYRKQ